MKDSKHTEFYDEKHIDELILPVKTHNLLIKGRIYTISKLLEKSERELYQINGFGRKSLEIVKWKLTEWRKANESQLSFI